MGQELLCPTNILKMIKQHVQTQGDFHQGRNYEKKFNMNDRKQKRLFKRRGDFKQLKKQSMLCEN